MSSAVSRGVLRCPRRRDGWGAGRAARPPPQKMFSLFDLKMEHLTLYLSWI